MVNAQIRVVKEGIAVGISFEGGKPWADYFLVGDKADKICDILRFIINECEPVIGDKHTMRESAKPKKKRGKK
jgi:hypothetical protein